MVLLAVLLLAGCGSTSSGSPSSSGSTSRHHHRSHHAVSHHRSRPSSRSGSTSTAAAGGPSTLLAPRTKTSGCVVNGALPDRACTPGAAFTGVTKAQVCVLGYSRRVRNVSSSTKRQVFLEYGIRSHGRGQYEVDHLVSLELGGSNSIANLWPEAASPQPGFHQKDMVENYLHGQLCSGHISLQQAQREISTNWLAVYHAMGH
jgi:hypothetical protein